MRKSRSMVEQMLQILRGVQAGTVRETVHRHGIWEKTSYAWKAAYGRSPTPVASPAIEAATTGTAPCLSLG